MKKFCLTDILIILVLFILSLSGIFYGSMKKENGRSVLVFTPYGEYQYSIEKDRIITVKGKLGEFIIEIKDKTVYVKETNCPKKICKQFKIRNSKESIVCPPNMIMIKISDKAQEEIDGITE